MKLYVTNLKAKTITEHRVNVERIEWEFKRLNSGERRALIEYARTFVAERWQGEIQTLKDASDKLLFRDFVKVVRVILKARGYTQLAEKQFLQEVLYGT